VGRRDQGKCRREKNRGQTPGSVRLKGGVGVLEEGRRVLGVGTSLPRVKKTPTPLTLHYASTTTKSAAGRNQKECWYERNQIRNRWAGEDLRREKKELLQAIREGQDLVTVGGAERLSEKKGRNPGREGAIGAKTYTWNLRKL